MLVVLVHFLLLWYNTSYQGNLARKKRIEIVVPGAHDGRAEAWGLDLEAKSSHLEHQAGGRESKVKVAWAFSFSKPTVSDTVQQGHASWAS